MQYIRIPKERAAVLIGSKGCIKRKIEEETKTQITVNDGEITIEGESPGDFTAKNIALAIGRGFNPEIALKLLDPEKIIEIIPLREILKSEKEINRKKGRVIGTKGKTRRFIEGITNTQIAVYGKSITILGEYLDVQNAKDAIMRLISGARHAAVYTFLETERAKQRQVKNYELPPPEEYE